MAAKSDYYDMLGVAKGATDSEIKSAYRKQALQWHPDKHKDNKEAAEKRFKEINEAYQILSDSEKRRAYDQFGHAAFSPGGAPGGGFSSRGGGFQQGQSPFGGTWKVYTSGGGPSASSGFGGFDFGDPFEIFEQFFGGGSPYRAARMPRYSITISFMEAMEGVEKEVSMGGKKKKIKIPAGVDDGSRIRFGDFILSINVQPHDVFDRDGSDLHVRVAIPFSTAVLGGNIAVPVIHGETKIKIRPGTQSGSIIRLRGKGAPTLRGRGHGDLYIRLNVAIPEKPSREQKKKIEEMKGEGL
jgi:DnaJ-class molecular chaperone